MINQQNWRHLPATRKIIKIGLTLLGLFLLYVIVGFWGVSPLLKPRAEKVLSAQLGRKVTIEEIKLNPLVLSATINHLTVYEPGGEHFAGFDTLYANVQTTSLFKWAMTLKEVRLVAPFGVVKLLPKGQMNIDDIVARLSSPKPEPEKKSGLPRAIISKFAVVDGRATITNAIGAAPIEETLSPITFTLHNLSTLKGRQGEYSFSGQGPHGGEYQMHGEVSVNPVRIMGRFQSSGTVLNSLWAHVKDYLSLQLIKATAASSGEYEIAAIDGEVDVRLSNVRFELKDLLLGEKGHDTVLVSLPSFIVQGVGVAMRAREITVGSVNLTDAGIFSWLAPDGTLKLQSLLLADLKALQEMKPAGTNEPEETVSRPWLVMVNEIEATGCSVAIEDRTLSEPAKFTLDDIKASVKDFSTRKNEQADVRITLQVNRSGSLTVAGKAGIDPLIADLQVTSDRIGLKPFQPYVDPAVKAKIMAGTTSSDGKIIYQGNSGEPIINYQGNFRFDGVAINDLTPNKDFVELHQLITSGIALDLLPNKLHVEKVLISDPKVRITIAQDGAINVVQAFTPNKNTKNKEQKDLLQRLVGFLIAQFKGPMPMDVKLIELNHFTGHFWDSSVSPPYKTQLEISKATVAGLSSAPSALADFKMKGTIDQSAAIEGSGQLNPMNALQYARVDFTMEDFALNPVSPYSGKFLGYKIAKGGVKTVLKYQVNDNRVAGDNQIFIDDLTLGDQVDSPDALDLPVALGVALLKDDEGRITLQAPVHGSVNDPKFDWGQVITSAITGTIKDAGKSPFAAIPKIEGFKGKELRYIAFEPGRNELNERETQKLNALAKFLKKRTNLALAIKGTADRQADWAALTGQPIEKNGAKEGQREKTAKGRTSGKAPAVDENQLQFLAQARAAKVRDHLIDKGGIAADRIKTDPAQFTPAHADDPGQVELFLSVQ